MMCTQGVPPPRARGDQDPRQGLELQCGPLVNPLEETLVTGCAVCVSSIADDSVYVVRSFWLVGCAFFGSVYF